MTMKCWNSTHLILILQIPTWRHCTVVLGLFSTDYEAKPDHFLYENSDKRLNSIHVLLYSYIIEHFSHPASLVLDLTSSQGKYIDYGSLLTIIKDNYDFGYSQMHTLFIRQAATAALTLRRNVISLVKGEDTAQLTRDNAENA